MTMCHRKVSPQTESDTGSASATLSSLELSKTLARLAHCSARVNRDERTLQCKRWNERTLHLCLLLHKQSLHSTDPLSRSISRLGQAFWQRFAVADCLECADYALQRQCEPQQSHSSEYWQPHCSPARLCISKTIL